MSRFYYLCPVLIVLFFSGCSGKGGVKDPQRIFPEVSNAGKGLSGARLKQESSLFFNDVVHSVKITINPNLFRTRVWNGSRSYSKVDLLEFDGEKLRNVGMRIRGSRWARRLKKRQFKLNFACKRMRTGDSGELKEYRQNRSRRFHGLKKLNLRCNPDNDPSLMVDKLTSELFRAAGAIYPRIGMARVWVNGQYMGMYLLTEHPDSTMLKVNLGNSLGNQFKGRWNGGRAMDLYLNNFTSACYKPVRKLNRWYRDDLKYFLNRLSAVSTLAGLAKLVNVDSLTSYWAAAVLAGHWDSLIGNKQNDHIFHNAADRKWYIIGWDGDNSFGIGERNRWCPWALSTTAPLRNAFGSNGKTLIFGKAHAIPEVYRMYIARIRSLMRGAFAQKRMMQRISRLAALVKPYLNEEPATSALTASGFDAAVEQLKDYVRRRHAYLSTVLPGAGR